MNRHPFIFSDERKYRLQRHAAFWLFWYVMQAFLYSFVAVNTGLLYFLRLKSSLAESLIYLIPHMLFSYSLIYFVIPRFVLKHKYLLTAFSVIIISILTAFVSAGLSLTVIAQVRDHILGTEYGAKFRIPEHGAIFLSLMAGLRGGMTVGGIAAAIKLMKHWYMKEQRILQLQKENIAAQLQLLKAQIHPHFLFNTLNNIYSYTQKVSPTGSKLVLGLSDLLRYVLHEGSRPSVSLAGEIKMLEDFMLLEQVRYGNRLEINKEIPADTKDLVIAPLLLLPFIENCFKHGTSQILEQAWIRLAIDIDNNTLKMTVINAKMPFKDEKPVSGIGILNVRKRLELLYPNKHELTITEEDDVFIVKLVVELQKGVTVIPRKEVNELVHA